MKLYDKICEFFYKSKNEDMKNKNEFGYLKQEESVPSFPKTYNPFKVTIDDIRQVNNEMINGLGVPEDKMMFKVHLTEKEINSIYGEVIQEIKKY